MFKMRRFLLIIISLLSTIVSFADDYSIVFVHIGNTLPDYLKTAVGQAKLFNDDASIYVIGNEEALLKIADGDFAQDINFVTCESLTRSDEHMRFIKNSPLNKTFRNGFWNHATERFFYLDDLVRTYRLENVFHLENDVMIYADLTKFLPTFKKSYKGMIAATFDNDQRCVPGFLYFSDPTSLARLTLFISYQVSEFKKGNDMVYLGLFRSYYEKTYIDTLPIVMPAYADFYPLKNLAKKASANPRAYYNNFKEFKSLFDAAALGQYLGGIDPQNIESGTPYGGKPGFINEACLFNPSYFTYEWEADDKGRKVPFAIFKKKKYPINNLHIHSKNLKAFAS